jgi:hypothetical protein
MDCWIGERTSPEKYVYAVKVDGLEAKFKKVADSALNEEERSVFCVRKMFQNLPKIEKIGKGLEEIIKQF